MPESSPLIDLGPPGSVLGIKAYRVGLWNGELTTPEELAEIVDNFALFTKSLDTVDPYYIPVISLFHNDALNFGRVVRCVVNGEYLELDIAGVPQVIRRWMKSDQLTAPSVEVWKRGTFPGPGGVAWPTFVLRCLTLLGADAPGAKGLPPLSAATFPGLDDGVTVPSSVAQILTGLEPIVSKYRDTTASVRKFSDLPPVHRPGVKTMADRTSMLKTLGDMGFPTDTITAGTDDATVKAFLDFTHKKLADSTKKQSDEEGKKGDEEVKKQADDKKTDEDEVKTFRDASGTERTLRVPKALAPLAETMTGLLDTIRTQSAATVADRTRAIAAERAKAVKTFRDEMTGTGRDQAFMTPAQFDAMEPLLLTLDSSTVRKYADGKTDGTALEEQFAKIRTAYATPIKVFTDKLADSKGTRGMTPERRVELLSATPEGQAILAREKAAAQK